MPIIPIKQICQPRFIPPAIIIAAGLMAYSNSFHGQYLLDDQRSIVENESIRQLWPPWSVLWPVDIQATITARPVINLSLAINYAIGGTDVRGYHVTNLAIHLLCAIVLYGIIHRTLALDRIPLYLRRHAWQIALAISLLWCVHPLQTAAVTYIIQRAESIMAMFYLLSLYLYIRTSQSDRPMPWYVLSIVCCWLGMASKEVMVSAPIMIMLYDRIFVTTSFKSLLRRRWWYYSLLYTSWILLLVMVWTTRSQRMAGFDLGVRSIDYALTQFGVITHYLRLCFLPRPLVFDYGIFITDSVMVIATNAVFIATLLFISVILLVRKPAVGFVCIFFFAALAPTSSILPMASQTAAEHRMYLSLASVITVLVIAMVYLGRNIRWLQYAQITLLIFAAAALGYQTYSRNENYNSAIHMWELTIKHRPNNHRAYSNLGVLLNQQRRYDEAIPHFNTALALKPDFATACHNKGVALKGLQQYEEAITYFSRALELDLIHPSIYWHRGDSYLELSRFDEAIRDMTNAITLKSDYVDAYYKRGIAYMKHENHINALADFNMAIDLNPGHAESYLHRGILLAKQKNYASSINDFTRAIEIWPEYGLAYKNRAISYYATNDYENAWRDVRRATDLGEILPPQFIELLTRDSNQTG